MAIAPIIPPNFATTTYKPAYTLPASITSMPLSLSVIKANPVPFALAAVAILILFFIPSKKRA